MHQNDDHFGDRALFGFKLWHRRAIEAARSKELRLAIVLAAFSAHYLEDSFAPGHIRAPRRGVDDILTLGIHDYFNRNGLRYQPAHIDSLIPLLDDATVASLAAPLARVCRPWDESHARNSAAACLERTEGSEAIWMRGDGDLDADARQELFVGLVVARSLADVLETFLTGVASDHFENVQWCGYRIRGGALDTLIRGTPTCPRGTADFHPVGLVNKLLGEPPPLTWYSPVAILPYGRFPQEEGELAEIDRDWGMVLHLSHHVLFRQRGVSRDVISAEFPFYAEPDNWIDAEGTSYEAVGNLWMTFGPEFAFDQQLWGYGPMMRVVNPVPQVNANWHIKWGYRWYHGGQGVRLSGFNVDVGAAIGFSHLYAGLGAGWQPYVVRVRQVRRGFALQPSITVILPPMRSWVRRLKGEM